MHPAVPRKRWRPGRGTLLVTIGTTLAVLAGYLGWTLDSDYPRLFVAVTCVGISTALYTFAVVTQLDPPDGDIFSPGYRRYAEERRLERLETEKKNARIRDIMRDVVGNPED